jgi:hypothetical protein
MQSPSFIGAVRANAHAQIVGTHPKKGQVPLREAIQYSMGSPRLRSISIADQLQAPFVGFRDVLRHGEVAGRCAQELRLVLLLA